MLKNSKRKKINLKEFLKRPSQQLLTDNVFTYDAENVHCTDKRKYLNCLYAK